MYNAKALRQEEAWCGRVLAAGAAGRWDCGRGREEAGDSQQVLPGRLGTGCWRTGRMRSVGIW